MTKVPTDLSGRPVVRALEKAGFVVNRPWGCHIILRRNYPRARVVVPDHKTLRIGTLRSILSRVGITVEDLLELI